MPEIFPGIHLIKMPISLEDVTLEHINVYLICGEDGYILVDTGWNTDDSLATLKKGLAEIGAEIGDISRIVVTHVHPDHYGLAGRIKRLTGAKLLMHDIEKGFISSRYIDMDDLLHRTGALLQSNGVPADLAAILRDATLDLEPYIDPSFPDSTLHHGNIISTGMFNFTVLWTPGHSSGHICLYEPDKKVLISGDHILLTITPNVSVNPQSIENPLGRYMQSLEDMKRLDVELVLPGHDTAFSGYQVRLKEIIQHHVERNNEILQALHSRAKTTFEIASEITWGTRARFTDLPDFHKRMAVFETLAHLDMMAAEGRLDRYPRNGVMYYRKT